MSSEIPFDLPENLVVMAGAGAGKTHALITIALHLLSGAREGGAPLPPAQLCALTFTEKAAAEMKARLRRRVAGLAGNPMNEAEPELAQTFRRLGLVPPPPDFFLELLDDVPLAFVGTFHALCAQLLRRWADPGGLSGEVTLLDERESAARLEQGIEATLFDALDSNGERADQARRLIRSLQLAGEGEGLGLREYLARMHAKLAEEGRAAESLVAELPSEAEVRTQLKQARQSAERALAALEPHRAAPALDPVFRSAASIREQIINGTADRESLEEAAEAVKLNLGPRTAKEAQREWKAALLALMGAQSASEELALDHAFIAMLAESSRRFAESKRREGVLDFSDLLGRTRALLRDHQEVRAEVQARVGALLVDEFQDTNPLQLELVALLSEARAGAPRALGPSQSAFAELPWEPRFLAAVGDRKQSIYEFRGAEVSLFTALAERLRGRGEGRVVHLRSNWRSVPPLIGFYNRLFARAMAGPSGQPFEVRYRAEDDDLLPRRVDGRSSPCAEILTLERQEDESSEALRSREAGTVADRVALLLDQGGSAPVRGGDIAILLRRYTHLEIFRRALINRGIPFVVVQGRGFFAAQEVRDLASLLRTLDEPEEVIAWAAVLRSPFVGLTDASLLRLARGKGGLAAVAEPWFELPPGLAVFEQRALSRFLDLHQVLQRDADRLCPSGCLELTLESLDVRAVLAAGFQGEQQVANVDKLLAWVRQREREGVRSAGVLARELSELASGDPKEGHAVILEEGDARAVRLMTVHQAKGLEFPVVFVPECGAGLPASHERVVYERTLGLVVKPRDVRGRGIATPRSEGVSARLTARAQAESLRLFYVALTRARDHLVLSGEARRGRPSWRSHLDALLDADGPAAGLAQTDGDKLVRPPVRAPSPSPPPSPEVRAEAASAVQRASRLPTGVPR